MGSDTAAAHTWKDAATGKENSLNAFNHYGKLDPNNASSDNVLASNKCIPIISAPKVAEESSVRTRRRVAIIGCLSVLLVAVICTAIVVPLVKNGSKNADNESVPGMIVTLCNTTLYPQTCEDSLQSGTGSDPPVTDSKDLVQKSVNVAHFQVTDMKVAATNLSSSETDTNLLAALSDCEELLDDALDMLNRTSSLMQSLNLASVPEQLEDPVTFMSAALTDLTTCVDGFEDLANSTARDEMTKLGASVNQFLSIALSLVNSLTSVGDDLSKWTQLWRDRGLLERPEQATDDVLPDWIGAHARRHLASNSFKVNVVVARDGSGKYKDIQAAIDAAPDKGYKLYVIYIKKGIYSGQFEVPKSKTNLMFLGDGIGQTIITGSRNVQMEGVTTFLSATLIIKGAGFIGKGFTVRNTAGPQSHQAVAMRVSADRVALWQCSFEAYQDTLYAHSLRQFYYQCTIEGTVDFVFGNGAALFQSCSLRPLVPLRGQQNTIAAQGRTDPSQNTGLMFHNCTLDGGKDLQRSISMYPTFLGRPWKQYARAVFIRSYLGKVINPAGWLLWQGDWALQTCYYAEFQNRGPGSSTKQRVWWSKQVKSANDVSKYGIPKFLGGNYWLPATNVPYESTIYS
ncbi:pectinesterase [Marchantia polymorpha subsp. ruderalis]|uniref:Pectinesterase n=2 Tax=Marchantia polymorpha TaxID=3197 RepID=A0A176VFD0_MARPO|nr:hypothetical protein AXG93_163s1390 [Marchantia polymorpha subsp. ruderalis]PTQ34746.1 hypothetical protein MARPO_0077s0062 [Marchantia polymorpha]BBN18136.1 hypothetical protein Mp_8g00060 [Marchantia polymorpha subsp. ruderalis]|eukprot:PTQ34746.1 hypothetical protein MARPO_0077s0062 [Marchantia polymorpha]